MNSHIPGPAEPDLRSSLTSSHPETWRNILHRDLESMAPMISQMHGCIWPEWTLRDKLDPEHAHEALMRLLLAEIVRIVDIPLSIGTRSLPRTSTPASSHLSATTSSRAANSQLQGPPKKPPPVLDAPGPSSSKKRNVSELGDEDATNPTRRRSARLAARRAQTPLDELIQRILALTWENRKFARKIENLSEDNSTTDPCIMTEVACD
ncbi:hypothetical protein CTheo_9204 [Ceratobasidium theobromae]|uniref:Uncharacterized protein n=1 Tax=Ceratobasidium theobromae TaxID=1582974 RepID=A0A5N5Q7E0_9AGAM|nr:hypothetical protein CTheo_9204 [Ceratobasidium theobromae]